MNTTRQASTKYPVLDIIKNRWSPRSFSDKAIREEELHTILEAGSWAFSANNEQPWRYVVAHRDTPGFNTLFNLLVPGNQPWNKNAAVLIISIGKKTFAANDKPNGSALHDVGAANMLLTLQANSMGIYTHLIGGFDREKTTRLLNLPEDLAPVVMIALGYPDQADKLEEPYRSRETAARVRKPLEEIILQQHNEN